MHRRRSLLFCLAFLGSFILLAQERRVDFRDFEKVVLDELKETNAPGAAVAIVRGTEVIFAKGFGVASVETNAAVTPEMLFRLGSTTKMLTAACLVSLAEETKVNLQEPLARYISNLHPKFSSITAHQLLSHTSGITDEAPMYGSHDEDALGNNIRSWKDGYFFTDPNRIYSYSNPGYWVAGLIIETVSGKRYADAMEARLFKPLGMSRTTLRPLVAMTYPLAQGHAVGPDGKPYVIRPAADNASGWPAGSVFSNVVELSRFVVAFMNNGVLDGKQVLAPSVIARLSTPHVSIPGSEGKYGYGLTSSRFRGVAVLQHGGSRLGYGSLIRMNPEHHTAVIILANRSGASLNKTAEKTFELLLPLEPALMETLKPELPLTKEELAECAGMYTNNRDTVKIIQQDRKLFIQQSQNQLPIIKVGELRFSVNLPAAQQSQEFVLVRDRDGNIAFLFRGGRAFRKMQSPSIH